MEKWEEPEFFNVREVWMRVAAAHEAFVGASTLFQPHLQPRSTAFNSSR